MEQNQGHRPNASGRKAAESGGEAPEAVIGATEDGDSGAVWDQPLPWSPPAADGADGEGPEKGPSESSGDERPVEPVASPDQEREQAADASTLPARPGPRARAGAVTEDTVPAPAPIAAGDADTTPRAARDEGPPEDAARRTLRFTLRPWRAGDGSEGDEPDSAERTERRRSESASPDAPEEQHGSGRVAQSLLIGAAVLGVVLPTAAFIMDGSDEEDAPGQSKAAAAGALLEEDGAPEVSPSPSGSATPSRSPSGKGHPTNPKPVGLAKPTVTVTKTTKATPSSRPTTSKPKAQPEGTTVVVTATRVLHPGESIATNRIRLAMQPDGNLVISDKDNRPLWASNTRGAGHQAVFQNDGNFVVYTADNRGVWSSGTSHNPGAVLVLEGDGDVVVKAGNRQLWSSRTAH